MRDRSDRGRRADVSRWRYTTVTRRFAYDGGDYMFTVAER